MKEISSVLLAHEPFENIVRKMTVPGFPISMVRVITGRRTKIGVHTFISH